MDRSCLLDTLSSQPVHFRLSVSFWLAALLICQEWEMSVAAEKPAHELAKFTLRDYIGREWQSELVFFKVDSALVGRKDAVLRDAQGREVPYQWSTQDDGSIAFLASVPKFTRVEYKLIQGTPKALLNVKVLQQPEMLEVANDKTGIRLYTKSEASQRGPIAGVKLVSGKWIGSGKLKWPMVPTDFQTSVLTDGPVFADLESTYKSS